MSIEIPISIKKYFDDNNKYFKQSVDALLSPSRLKELPGNDPISLENALDFNKATLLAEQTRYEYCEYMLQLTCSVWKNTATSKRFNFSIHEENTPDHIWENKYVSLSLYRVGKPETELLWLYLTLGAGRDCHLTVQLHDDRASDYLANLCERSGKDWTPDQDSKTLEIHTPEFHIKKFLNAPDKHIDILKSQAKMLSKNLASVFIL
jgi:hypothetical protein